MTTTTRWTSSLRVRALSRECTQDDYVNIKIGLEHARVARVLDSYREGSALFDGCSCLVMLDAGLMLTEDRGNFGCEEMIAQRVIDKAMSLHRPPSGPPRSA